MRYHAVIVDEGQDFAIGWLESLQLLLRDQDHGVFWVFHDPAQALFRPDVVVATGLGALAMLAGMGWPAWRRWLSGLVPTLATASSNKPPCV